MIKSTKKLKSVEELIKLVNNVLSKKMDKREKVKVINSLIKQIKLLLRKKGKKPKREILKQMEEALVTGKPFAINSKNPSRPNPIEEPRSEAVITIPRNVTPLGLNQLADIKNNLTAIEGVNEKIKNESLNIFKKLEERIENSNQLLLEDLKEEFSLLEDHTKNFMGVGLNELYRSLINQQQKIKDIELLKVKEKSEIDRYRELLEELKRMQHETGESIEGIRDNPQLREQEEIIHTIQEQKQILVEELKQTDKQVEELIEETKKKLSGPEASLKVRREKQQQKFADFDEAVKKIREALNEDKISEERWRKIFPRSRNFEEKLTRPSTSTEAVLRTQKFNDLLSKLTVGSGKYKSNSNIMKGDPVYELTNGRYGSQYNQYLEDSNMKDREEHFDGSIHHPKLQIRAPARKVVGSGYDLKLRPSSTDLERMQALFYKIGIDGVTRIMQGVPQNDEYIYSLSVHPIKNVKQFNCSTKEYIGGRVFKDAKSVYSKLSKTHKMQGRDKLAELYKILMSKKG